METLGVVDVGPESLHACVDRKGDGSGDGGGVPQNNKDKQEILPIFNPNILNVLIFCRSDSLGRQKFGRSLPSFVTPEGVPPTDYFPSVTTLPCGLYESVGPLRGGGGEKTSRVLRSDRDHDLGSGVITNLRLDYGVRTRPGRVGPSRPTGSPEDGSLPVNLPSHSAWRGVLQEASPPRPCGWSRRGDQGQHE